MIMAAFVAHDEPRFAAYVAKVLGPKITVLASETFPDAGEWNNVEQTIRLSTAAGPGVLSVAYHEAMHGLWSRLIKDSPSAAQALAKVMSGPAILDRLKAELANEPAALTAITTGPHAVEERVAYAYQFWAAGLLDVDKPATTVFAKVRKFLRKVLGMVRESETALDIITAFHDGKLAEPSAAGRVIDKIMKDSTWNEDVKRKFDKHVQGIHAAIATSNQVLRAEELSATAQALGLTMFTNPGEASAGRFKKGYINARRQVTAQYTNYLYDALKGLSPRDMVLKYFEFNKSGSTASEIAKATNMDPCLTGQVAARMYRAGTLTFELCKRPGNKQLIRVYSPVSNT